jgi:hypothetical protein
MTATKQMPTSQTAAGRTRAHVGDDAQQIAERVADEAVEVGRQRAVGPANSRRYIKR